MGPKWVAMPLLKRGGQQAACHTLMSCVTAGLECYVHLRVPFLQFSVVAHSSTTAHHTCAGCCMHFNNIAPICTTRTPLLHDTHTSQVDGKWKEASRLPYETLLKQAQAIMAARGTCNTWLVASDEIEFEEAASAFGALHGIRVARFNTTNVSRRCNCQQK